MDYKRILLCVILFSLLIATTSVAFASDDTNIVIDDDSDDYIDDEIVDITDEYEYSIWDYLQIEVTPDNADFNATDNVVWNVTIKNNANSTFENLNLALYVDGESSVYDLTYLNFTKGILGDSDYYFPVSEYLTFGSFNPGETAEIYIQTMASYPEDVYLICYFLNSNNECTGDLSDFEIDDYDMVAYCFDIFMSDVDDFDDGLDDCDGELDDSDGGLDDSDGGLDDCDGELDDCDGGLDDCDGELDDKFVHYGDIIYTKDYYCSDYPLPSYSMDEVTSVGVAQLNVSGKTIAGQTDNPSGIISHNNVAENIDQKSAEELTEDISKIIPSKSGEKLINEPKSISDVVLHDSINNVVDNGVNTSVVKSISKNIVSSMVFNYEVQSENQNTDANDANNADNNVRNDKVVKSIDNNSSGINYGIIGILLIAIICIFVAYKKFN